MAPAVGYNGHYTYEKGGMGGGAEKVLAMVKVGGHEKFLGSFYAVACFKVLAILKWGCAQKVFTLKMGGAKFI